MKLEIKEIGSTVVHEIGSSGAVLGRGRSGTDILVRGGSVSKEHARIFFKDDGWYIEDLGSANGTFVGDRPVTKPTPLNVGSHFKLGKKQFQVVYLDFDMEAEVTKPAAQAPAEADLMRRELAGDTIPQRRPTLDYSVAGKNDYGESAAPLTPAPIDVDSGSSTGEGGNIKNGDTGRYINEVTQPAETGEALMSGAATKITKVDRVEPVGGSGTMDEQLAMTQMPEKLGTLDETMQGGDPGQEDATAPQAEGNQGDGDQNMGQSMETRNQESGRDYEVNRSNVAVLGNSSDREPKDAVEAGQGESETEEISEEMEGIGGIKSTLAGMNKLYLAGIGLAVLALIVIVIMVTGNVNSEKKEKNDDVAATAMAGSHKVPANSVDKTARATNEPETAGSSQNIGEHRESAGSPVAAGKKVVAREQQAGAESEQGSTPLEPGNARGTTPPGKGKEKKKSNSAGQGSTPGPWQIYSGKLKTIEDTITRNPRLLRDKTVYKEYERFLKVSFAIAKKYNKKIKKQPWRKKLIERLRDLALMKNTGNLVDKLFKRLCGVNGDGCPG
ncbi:MAG: FHA domain-containing protein [Deltaproteobacteria bacterium]|nr:FHA domain-containing protein [Deltaproteobacteria bacterium]